jgi:very-short-patch-repair endonuclease
MRGPNRSVVGKVRRLRRNSTNAEMRLWLALRDRRLGGFKFVRQEAIGPYIVDFICREQKLIVEVDGGQHAENKLDRIRDAYLATDGFRVLRFWNHDVLSNKEGVLTAILSALQIDRD